MKLPEQVTQHQKPYRPGLGLLFEGVDSGLEVGCRTEETLHRIEEILGLVGPWCGLYGLLP